MRCWVRILLLALTFLAGSFSSQAQTVYFAAWGGSPAVNQYLQWAAEQLRSQGIVLKQVKVADIAEVVKAIQQGAGSDYDLLWLNGENFHALKAADALQPNLWQQLPEVTAALDKALPLQSDFGEAVDGFEVPWGIGQFIALSSNDEILAQPLTAERLLQLAQQYRGRLSYPKPPEFHGTTLLKQLLISLTDADPRLYQPASESAKQQLLPQLWRYLDKLHPLLWRQGQAFPSSYGEQIQWLANRQLDIAWSFNPNDIASLKRQGRLPATVERNYFAAGAITNAHYLAIPKAAAHPQAALTVIRFLLSHNAQQRKADPQYWGDPSVRNDLASATARLPSTKELHASWETALEQGWLARYQ
ncbi:ABC transporter substrate-binding protein [Idiomarina tyrosinivorans]|uniref:ABC transporter substrate-binding protein n=1 Tax=Idiomarina tyrosinivorans TaxID=1445662 RepID=A0A432ZQL3_9GAMM|nr:ABC transporter substrate-binding protein [Idiomarina tyrosinivorans]RUO80225.1 ABC transporter substrate-binding protein [Idiomarina tyrosinivorans]